MDLSTEIEDAIQSLQDTFLAKYRHEMIQAWPGRVATTGEPRGMNQHAGLYSAFLCDGRDGGSDGIVVKRLEAFQRRTQPREALTVHPTRLACRSEEHTSELQSPDHLVYRLL